MAHHYKHMAIQGYLGRDAELHYTPSGMAVCDMNIASTVTHGQGEEKRDETLWVKIVLWKKQAEALVQHLKKGTQIIASGSNFKTEAWIDKQGEPQARIVLTAQSISFAGSAGAGQQSSYTDADYPYGSGAANTSNTSDNDDIPF